MNTIKAEVAKNLLFYRKQSQMTQKELAERLGVKYNTVSSWESGTNSIDIEVLFRVCEIFGVSLDDMYGVYANDSRPPLSPDESELLSLYRCASDDDKSVIDAVLKKYKDVEKKEKRA